jgi:hypothetical protein
MNEAKWLYLLVHHHDGQKRKEGGEKETVQIVFDGIADGDVEAVNDGLADGEKCGSKDNVANRPSVVQSADDEDELKDDINDDAKCVEDVGNDPETQGLGGCHSGYTLERGNSNKGNDKPDNERGNTEELPRGL